MYSIISSASIFIGVSSGPFVMALSINPNKVIHLKKSFDVSDYTKLPVRQIDINNFNERLFRENILNIISVYE